MEQSVRLRQIRMRCSFTQAQCARKLGYRSASGYANLESGRNNLTAQQAVVLADMFDCTVDELLGEKLKTIMYSGKEYTLISDFTAQPSKSFGYANFMRVGDTIDFLEIAWNANSGFMEAQRLFFSHSGFAKAVKLYQLSKHKS